MEERIKYSDDGSQKLRNEWKEGSNKKMSSGESVNRDIGYMSEPEVFRIDHLMLISQALERLGIKQLVDERIAGHKLQKLTHGRCLEALILCILTGRHTLYRVREHLSEYDLELLFKLRPGEREILAEQLSDNRLAAMLDELWKYGLNKLNVAISLKAIKEYELEMKQLHFDTTSLALFGQYKESLSGNAEESPPYVTFGYSKDHRPDLKQILFGLTTTGDGNVPLLGRITDGNQTDTLENRVNIERMVAAYPDLTSSLLVADSKFFSGLTIELANLHKLSFVTLMPETKAKQAAIAYDKKLRDEGNEPPLLSEKNGRDEGLNQWHGRSTTVTHNYEVEVGSPDKDGKVQKETRSVEVRALIIESTQLREQKKKTLQQQIKQEAESLEKLIKSFAKLSFSCQQDAELGIEKALKIKKREIKNNQATNASDNGVENIAENQPKGNYQFHDVRYKLEAQDKTLPRTKIGRPKKAESATIKRVWKVEIEFNVKSEQILNQWLDKESKFVLAANPNTNETYSDRDLLLGYKQQYGIEGSIAWLKGVANIAPIFLEKEERIAALGLVYIIALMVNALIQREIRRLLAQQKTQIPGNRGWTNIPTSTVLFRLFEGLNVIHYQSPLGPIKLLVGLSTEQARVLQIMGNDLLNRPDLVVGQINKPTSGQRGYRAAEHRRGRAYKGSRNKRKKLLELSSQ